MVKHYFPTVIQIVLSVKNCSYFKLFEPELLFFFLIPKIYGILNKEKDYRNVK
jgi:hypothetical protein